MSNLLNALEFVNPDGMINANAILEHLEALLHKNYEPSDQDRYFKLQLDIVRLQGKISGELGTLSRIKKDGLGYPTKKSRSKR